MPAPAPGAIIKQDHARGGRCHSPDTRTVLLTSIDTHLHFTVLIDCHVLMSACCGRVGDSAHGAS
jgi:hypothetical protein